MALEARPEREKGDSEVECRPDFYVAFAIADFIAAMVAA